MYSTFDKKDSYANKKTNSIKHQSAKIDYQSEISTNSLFNPKFHMTGTTKAASETDNLCNSNMKGPAFSKQPNIPNEFQQLRDPRIGILTKQQLEKRNASGKNWHAISFNGKKIYGSDTAMLGWIGGLTQVNHGLVLVTANKPKMLTGLDQKVRDGMSRSLNPNTGTQTSPGNTWNLIYSCHGYGTR
ncbi:hypothetical protein [Photorhabdus laumondii]|uniref:Uncharacterized protein n=1 Tax=Photorhabdus laumondii subsp. clarkei TaxID=2029685 RepID=A0A329VKK8_9GAMM|nr:hypothetical protein [Photorhabdus laumondii]RAW92385.1 hypothetical protein CKY01_05475 [Photorhabdus laumondii subsp. clarkei]